MKLKGVNPIEQHIEKIVLVLVLVMLLGVLAMQFVMRPNDIEVTSTRKVSPDKVYTVLEDQANLITSQLSDLSPSLPQLKQVDLVSRYNQAFENATGGSVRLSSALGQGVDIASAPGTRIVITPEQEGPIAALKVPMTSTPLAASQWATLDPYAAVQVPEYAKYVPAAQPFDFASVTIESTFGGKDLQSALSGIPRRFWSATGIAILGFEVERQELMSDGTWGVSAPIETPPHTPMPTGAIVEGAGLLELTEVVAKAAGVVDEVARPMFPPTIAGGEWSPPSDRVTSTDTSESSVITRLQRRLERTKAELDRLQNPPAGGPPPGGGGGGKTNDRDRRPTPTTRPDDRNRDRIEKLTKEITDLEKQLKDLGVKVEDSPRFTRAQTSRNDRISVLEMESIDLWAHDLGVVPGVTYRYRTRVVVNNPLFRKNSELNPDDAAQQALALEPFARGEWSGWSDNVVVGAKEYFFIANAESGGVVGASGSKATIEVYKMFYGHYRKSTLSVSPGDELATVVRMSGNLLQFDTGSLELADAIKAVEALGDKDSSALPAGISELSNRLTIDLGAYVLDIYPGSGRVETNLGQALQPMRVVLRDSDGTVVVRSDVNDKASSAYVYASKSASEASATPLRAPGAPAVSPAAALFVPKVP